MLNLFLDRHERLRRDKKIMSTFIVSSLLFTQLCVLIFCIHYFNLKNHLGHDIAKAGQQIMLLQYQKKRLEKILGGRSWSASVTFQDVTSKIKRVALLRSLGTILPGNCYLTLISLEKKQLILEGTILSSDDSALRRFIEMFEKHNHVFLKNKFSELTDAVEQKFHVVFVI